MKPRTIAICGNGAGAALLLLALTRFDRPLSVIVIGTGHRCGAGVAYSTTNPNHLLNTPAGRMSSNPLLPQEFKSWLQERGFGSEDFAKQFVSRSLYSEYLHELLKDRLSRAAQQLDARFIHAEVHNLTRDGAGWSVIHGGGIVFADVVVLATGNDMPARIAPLYREAAHQIIDNPWGGLPLMPQEDVLVLGTGLTAMDTVVTLLDRGHRGAIHLLSRRGLCPARHVSPLGGKTLPRPFPATAREILRAMRRAVGRRSAPAEWQSFIDSMRPFWAEIWQSFAPEEKQRFLRHGMTYWSVHRHRLAPAMSDRFEAGLRGDVKVMKGRLTGLSLSGSAALSAEITYRRNTQLLRVNRVINCTGPNSDPTKSYYPLIQNIIASHHARSGPTNLGLDVDEKNRVLDATGRSQADLFALGALTRGRWWEVTAIPEISYQAAEIADSLQAFLSVLDSECTPTCSLLDKYRRPH